MSDSASKTVLVVDDESVIRDSLKDYLEDRGYRVLTARDGQVGVDLFKAEQPDAVLTDLRMPAMDGLEVLRQIGECSPGTPLIVASGTGRITDSIEALRLGAWDYILKPIEDMSIVSLSLEKAFERVRLINENRQYQKNLEAQVRERTRELENELRERLRAEEANARLQAQLLQSQKMESVGRLAGGVAHDFNNMLQAILGNAEIALDGLEPSDARYDELKEIVKACDRCAQLAQQLLAFARKQAIMPEVFDLNKALEDMLDMLRRLIGEDIHIEWKPAPSLPPLRMDPSQLDQVLANLCVNARDAIKDVGRILIETSLAHLGPDDGEGEEDFVPGPHLLLQFSDTGPGMDAYTLERAFDPFFTTKEVGKGTGLGLATVYGIVKQNKGILRIDSAPGRGTTFSIYLPACLDDRPADNTPAQTSAVPDGNETVLIVEDEHAILEVSRRILEKAGYQVLVAHSPREALQKALDAEQRIDLLISDVVMPGMNGCDLAREIQAAYPHVRTLFMSGFSSTIVSARGVLPDGLRFLKKPFTSRELAEQARAALNDPPARLENAT